MHAVDVIHRDVKLGNVLVDPETCSVRIADFGIARTLA